MQSMSSIDGADTAFVLISAALVMLMTPGLALFYGGMVRAKNVLGTIMHSVFLVGLVSILWALVGYTLAFGPDQAGLIGGLDWLGLIGVGTAPEPAYSTTIPHAAFMVFQMMFAVITPALITGAFAERMRFRAFVAFSVLWMLFVYSPVAHWVWGSGGWLRAMGVMDFAGGLVVHLNSAAAALAAAIVIGRRTDYGSESLIPHNLPLTVLGGGLLWFGWFGFNAGSALGANGVAVSAFIATHLAGAAAGLSWTVVEWRHRGRPTTLGVTTGFVAGLATVTPAAGFVSPISAMAIGVLAGGLCYYAVLLKSRLGYDDALDVVGVHGAGGVIGTLAVGVFASAAVNAAGANGLLLGNPAQLGTQAFGVLVILVYSLAVSFALLKLVDRLFGLRINQDEEDVGLDLSQHAEAGYALSGRL
jgi:ammonium transporter, Amt family